MIILASAVTNLNVHWGELWMKMGWLDIVLLLAFAIGVFMGLQKGLARVFPHTVEILSTQLVTLEYSKFLADFFQPKLPIPGVILHPAVFILLAAACILINRILAQMLAAVVTVDFKSPVNNAGGALVSGFNLVLYLSLISALLILIPVPFIQNTFQGQSLSGPFLAGLSQQVHDFFARWLPLAWRVK